MTNRVPYTYIIGWSSLDKWYYGVRYAKNCKPEDLWKTYFTSSKYVKEFKKINGDPDIIKVRKTFDNINEAREWEHKVLRRLNVVKNEKFINETDNISISLEASLKGSLKSTNKGQKRPHLSILNSKKVRELNHMWGRIGELAPCFGRTGDKHLMFGKKNPMSSIAAKLKIKCPYCDKIGNTPNMKRWHFDNCKINITNKESKNVALG